MRQRARHGPSSGGFEPEGWGKLGKCCGASSSDGTWVARKGWWGEGWGWVGSGWGLGGGWSRREVMAPEVSEVLGQGWGWGMMDSP